MKMTAITSITIFIISLVCVVVFNMISTDGIFIAASIPPLSHEDKTRLSDNRERLFKSAATFNEKFYKSIAGDEPTGNKPLGHNLRQHAQKIESELLTSSLLNELFSRANTYMHNAMDAKSRIVIDNLTEKNFVVAFDSIHYNYTAFEAVMRIIDKVADIKKAGRRFLPDEVTDTALASNACAEGESDPDDYENSLAWFLSANALKYSFDVLYLQVMFGKPFYPERELRAINRKMGRIMATMRRCTPPKMMGKVLKDSYASSLIGFENKIQLAEYRSFAVFQSDTEVMKMIDSIYVAPGISASTARSVGYEAFHTLGMITLFELYSQNY